MRRPLRTARFALPAGMILVALLAPTPASAGLADPVGPNQGFGGWVNGSSGRPSPAVIRMACLGPIQPGQTGHPMSGQSVTLFEHAATAPRFGRTGPQSTSVGAFFNAPPPEGRMSPATSSFVDFKRYGTRALPTSLTLPCSGTGTVYFVPLPAIAGGRTATVPVSFVGQP